MDWLEFFNDLFQMVGIPLILALGGYAIAFFSAKTRELKTKTDNETAQKYLDMLNTTIANAVLATTQTYVEALKNENVFDKDAQKAAFEKTYNAVFAVLTEEAVLYLQTVIGDLDTYVTNQIEATVRTYKNI